MPSTYTTNNGIELIATGEQSGTWGDTTNTNLSLLDTSLDGQVSITLAATGSSGSPNLLPINNGATSNGRNRLVIFADGGDLGGTAFVQLTPNDAEKIIYIRNNLSGSRSILAFQGTYNASNDYEIPAGTTAVVYFDGGGTGAVAANVFNNAYFDSLRLGAISVTAVLDEDNMSSDSATALATQQSIKAYVDTQITAEDLDFAGDSGTGAVDLDSQTLTIAGTANEIETAASGQTLTVGLPDNVTITGDLTVDTNTLAVDSTNNRVGIGTSSPSQKLTVNGTDARIYLTGANTDIDMDNSGSGQLSLDGNAYAFGIALNSSGANLYTNSVSRNLIFGVNETEVMRVTNDSVGIGTSSPSATIDVSGNARGAVTTDNDLSFDLSATNNFSCTPTGAGTLTFTNHLAGQSGFILLDNSGGHAIAAAATTKINAADLTAISTAGVYTLSYFDNGTNAYVSVSRSFA